LGLFFAFRDLYDAGRGKKVNHDNHWSHNIRARHCPIFYSLEFPLVDVLHVLLRDFLRWARTSSTTLWRPRSFARCSQAARHRGHNTTCWNWNFYILWGGRYDLRGKIGNLNPLCLVVVARRDNLIVAISFVIISPGD
jgi:hypothetical protein